MGQPRIFIGDTKTQRTARLLALDSLVMPGPILFAQYKLLDFPRGRPGKSFHKIHSLRHFEMRHSLATEADDALLRHRGARAWNDDRTRHFAPFGIGYADYRDFQDRGM